MVKAPVLLIAVFLCTAPPLHAEEVPPFEKLLGLNAQKLFGGEVKIEGEAVTIIYNKPGKFETGFEGNGSVNPDDVKGHSRKLFEKPEGGGELDHIALAGRGDGDWTSRFELVGPVRMTFNLRIPAFQKGSQVSFRLLDSGKWFQQATVAPNTLLAMTKGRKKPSAASFAETFFDPKALVAVQLTSGEGQFKASLKKRGEGGERRGKGGRGGKRGKAEKKEGQEKAEEKDNDAGKDKEPFVHEVVLDDPDAPASCKIRVSFSKMTMAMTNVQITGKISRSWCEAQLKELEAKNLLVLKEKPAEEAPAGKRPRLAAKKEEETPEQRKKESEEEL